MPNARPTPGLRLTLERREQLERVIAMGSGIYPDDARLLLGEIDALRRERDDALALVVALCRATGITADAVRAELNRRAALAASAQERGEGA